MLTRYHCDRYKYLSIAVYEQALLRKSALPKE